MLLCVVSYIALILVVSCLAADQDILTILKQQKNTSSFVTILEQYPEVVDILNQGVFSVLVPNDAALDLFATENPALSNSEDLLAVLQYHIANGTHPSATFGLQPLFVPTLLNNPNFSNVTGGQVVEMAIVNDSPTIISGVKAESHVLEPDIFYQGGLIHILDSVLTIPISFPATITKSGLNNLVALLNKGGWLDPSSPAIGIVNDLADLTIFGPNDPAFGATFEGWVGLSEDDLLSIFKYSISQGPVLYSSGFENGTKIPTLQQLSATLTETNNGTFHIDAALITAKDYLTSNGVLHVLDSPLNPNTTNERPVITPISSPGSKSSGLSAAAGAGIGIAIGAILLGGALIIALYIRTKRRRRMQGYSGARRGHSRLDGESRERVVINSDSNGDPPPTYELDTKSTRPGRPVATTTHVIEVQNNPPKPPSPLEIDGTETSRISISIQGNPPRHLGFQAKYD